MDERQSPGYSPYISTKECFQCGQSVQCLPNCVVDRRHDELNATIMMIQVMITIDDNIETSGSYSDEEIATLHMAPEEDIEEAIKLTKSEAFSALDKLRHFVLSHNEHCLTGHFKEIETFIEKVV